MATNAHFPATLAEYLLQSLACYPRPLAAVGTAKECTGSLFHGSVQGFAALFVVTDRETLLLSAQHGLGVTVVTE